MRPLSASVIITTYNDDQRLLHTLWGFIRQHRPEGEPWELIVVNDGGYRYTDKLVFDAAIEADNWDNGLRGIQYHYLEPATPDFRLAAARNLGLSAAQGLRTIICDCDTVPEDHFVRKHTHGDRLQDVLVGLRRRVTQEAVESFTEPVGDEVVLNAYVWQEDERTRLGAFKTAYDALPDHPRPHIVCWGCNFSASTEAMRAIGGFDESFVGWGGEDEDMADRLGRHGLKFHRTDAVVYHLDHPPRSSQNASHRFKPGQGEIVRNGGPLSTRLPEYL